MTLPTTRLIAIENVTLVREGRGVFAGLDLHLTERRVGIVGRNGSGKSSLVRLAAGLIVPQAGRVTVNGVDVGHDRDGALATVGILFQNPDHQIIFPTVIDELTFGLEQQGRTRIEALDIARAMLARFGHADWEGQLCHMLSQGQRQLVCLMAVLAMDPAWVLFDEPFNSLDLPAALRIEARIADLAQNAVLVTHDPARLRGFDRVIWLDEGRIAADGPPGAVLPIYIAAMERAARDEPC